MAGKITHVNWRCAVLAASAVVTLCVYLFTDELDPRTVARFSVDHRVWEQQPTRPKMTDEEEEAAGLGHHVHTHHDRQGGVVVVNAKGQADAREHVVQMKKQKKDQYKYPHKLPERPPPERLLSAHKPVTSQSRGNLGPPSVITDGKNADWLKDRWQAKDMSGSALPLPQWIMIDLGAHVQVTRMVLDWETAFAKAYHVELSEDGKTGWHRVYETSSGNNKHSVAKHVTHELALGGSDVAGWNPNAKQEQLTEDPKKQGRYVRLTITQNGAPYGASLWEWQVYGFPVGGGGGGTAAAAAAAAASAPPNATATTAPPRRV